MTVAERLHDEALHHLAEARGAMKKLAGCTPDWSARVQVDVDFNALEETCRDFGRYQFGLFAAPIPENTEK